jgi:DNA polymerase III delta prime subunit
MVGVMKTISDIFKTMTQEEREQHKDLINECLKREYENKKNFKNIKDSVEKLTKIIPTMFKNLETINEESQKANLLLQKTDGKVH